MNLLLGMDLETLWAWMEDYAEKVLKGEYQDRKQEHMHLLEVEDYMDTPPINEFDSGVEFDWSQSKWKHDLDYSIETKLTKYNESSWNKILIQITIIRIGMLDNRNVDIELDILVRFK